MGYRQAADEGFLDTFSSSVLNHVGCLKLRRVEAPAVRYYLNCFLESTKYAFLASGTSFG